MKIEQLEKALETAQKAGLGLTSLRALIHIENARSLFAEYKLTDLATLCGVSTAAITGQADRLEKAGLAKRHHSDKDRRTVYLSITDKGAGLAKKILNQ